MTVRGARRRRGCERGFVLSDHADWPALVQTARQSGARQVYVTHGQSDVLARYLREVEGIAAEPLQGGGLAERGDPDDGTEADPPGRESAEPEPAKQEPAKPEPAKRESAAHEAAADEPSPSGEGKPREDLS
jgi:putative mRNA 3-end processing factor